MVNVSAKHCSNRISEYFKADLKAHLFASIIRNQNPYSTQTVPIYKSRMSLRVSKTCVIFLFKILRNKNQIIRTIKNKTSAHNEKCSGAFDSTI